MSRFFNAGVFIIFALIGLTNPSKAGGETVEYKNGCGRLSLRTSSIYNEIYRISLGSPKKLGKTARGKLLEKPIRFASEYFELSYYYLMGLLISESAADTRRIPVNVMQIKSKYLLRKIKKTASSALAEYEIQYRELYSEVELTEEEKKIAYNIIGGAWILNDCLKKNYRDYYMAGICYNLGDSASQYYRFRGCKSYKDVLKMIKKGLGPKNAINRSCFPLLPLVYAKYYRYLDDNGFLEGFEDASITEIDEYFCYKNPSSPLHRYIEELKYYKNHGNK